MSNFEIQKRTDFQGIPIAKFEAIISQVDLTQKGLPNPTYVDKETFPKFIRVPADGTPYAILKSVHPDKGNHAIFFSTFWQKVDAKNSYRRASKWDFFSFRLSNDKSQFWALVALIAVVIGSLIDLAFAVGRVKEYLVVSVRTAVCALALASLLKIVGLWFTFKKGFWDAK